MGFFAATKDVIIMMTYFVAVFYKNKREFLIIIDGIEGVESYEMYPNAENLYDSMGTSDVTS